MFKKLSIMLSIVISGLLISSIACPAVSSQETIVLTYDGFDELNEVCSEKDNWCGWADFPGKAIVYGYMNKIIEVPDNAVELEVTIQICSNGWGEGLAVDIDKWTSNSALQIIVDEQIAEEKIPELSSKDIHYHHHSYFKYEHGESFSHTYNTDGKESILLKIKMVDGARIDFQRATLIYHIPPKKYKGICYGPFRDNESPDFGILPTQQELHEDIFFISKLSDSIRTYGIADSLSKIPGLCQEVGVDCYPGAWISSYKCENEKEIQSLIKVANQSLECIKALVVGNEALLRKDISENELIDYIERVRNNTNLPISTVENWKEWLEHPQLVEKVDFILVNIHPYWDGISNDQAADYIVEKWEEIKTHYPEKSVIISETGWPSQGDNHGSAFPSEENQKNFLSDFLCFADSENISYFYFELFDEKWKEESEASVGNHWGLYYSNGSLKPLLEELIPEQAREGIDRPPRELTVVEAVFPLFIYLDGCLSDNRFYPSGWTGDLAGWSGDPLEIIDEYCTESPHSGETCVRITYLPDSEKWGGIYWQYPRNNWGDYPAYAISKEVKLTFWARGKEGGERAEFKSGGIEKGEKSYCDSFGPISTDPTVIKLSKEWEKYSIDLKNQDLSMVIGGFYWATDQSQNPDGCTIYLDDIQFEPLIEPPFGVGVYDVPDDNGHSLMITWLPSLSEKDSYVTWYQIYRSRSDVLTEPIPILAIASFEELKTLEMDKTILIDTVEANGADKYEYIDACVPVNGVLYYYWVQAVWEYGESEKVVAGGETFVVEDVPFEFQVSNPYPNPFNPATTIQYKISIDFPVKLVVYDILGRQIAVLQDGMVSAGVHEIVWNGKNQDGIMAGSGVYIYQVIAGSNKAQGKIMFLR